MTIILNYLSSRLLISISFSSFSDILFFHLECISVSSFCTCFCVFNRSVTSASLEGMTLMLILSSDAYNAVPRQSPEAVLGVGYVHTPVVAE